MSEEKKTTHKRPLSEATPEEREAYYRRKRERARRKRERELRRRALLAFSILGVIFILVFGIAIARLISGKKTDRNSSDLAAEAASEKVVSASSVSPTPARKIQPAEIKMTFTGDVLLGTDEAFDYSTSMNAYYDTNTPDYFLQNVRSIFQQDDLTIINFESTLTEETARNMELFAFKAPPEYVNILKDATIDAANVANNHSHDYGEKSFTDTKQVLTENNITPFGYDEVIVKEVKGVRIGIFGIYELDEYGGVAPQVTECMNKLKAQNCDMIIAVFHWGNELEPYPDHFQVELGHQAIDEGADLVVGHHPHVVQGIEYYKGKTIAYSLGNFLFGGNSHPTEMDTMIFQMTFGFDEQAKITSQSINVIPCLVSTTEEYNDYCPTVRQGDGAAATIAKIDTRSQQIADNYSGIEAIYNSSAPDHRVQVTQTQAAGTSSSQGGEEVQSTS